MSPDLPLPTRASLLSRLRRSPGDSAGWREFVRIYGPRIYQWCIRFGLQDADAQDVTQNVLLQVTRAMQTFVYDPTRTFRGWLRTLTHRAWCDWVESRRRAGLPGDSQVLQVLETVEARDELARRLEEQFDQELLQEAMTRVRLRVEVRTWDAFRLTALEDLSGAEAAVRLEMKVPAVFMARSRVQKMIQETLQQLEASDGE